LRCWAHEKLTIRQGKPAAERRRSLLSKETLRRFPLFSDLDDDELALVAAVAEKEYCSAGKRLADALAAPGRGVFR
jgi:uncharacterized OsmC-like protein